MKSRKSHQRTPTQLGQPDDSNLGRTNTEDKRNKEEKAMGTDLQPVHDPPSTYSAPLENDLPPSAFLPMVDVGMSADNPRSSFSLGDSYNIGDEELRDVFLSIVGNVYEGDQILPQDSDELPEKDLPPLAKDDCLQAENEGEEEEREVESEASETKSIEGRKNRKRKHAEEGEKSASQQEEDEKNQQGEKQEPSKGKTKKRRRRRKAAVPRPTNCFLIFANDFRTALRQRYPNMSNKEVSVHLGRIWKKLSDKDKQPYLRKAAEMKEAHKRAYPHYTYGVPRKVNRGKNVNPRSNRHTTSSAYNENTPQHHLHNEADNPTDAIDGSTYNHPLSQQQRTHSLPSSPPPTQQSPLSQQQHPHMQPHPQQTYSPSFGTEAFEESLYAETMGDPSSMARAYEINPSATENAETSIAHAIWEQYKFANADRLGLNLPAQTQNSYHQHPPTYPTSTTSTPQPYRPHNPQSMPDSFAKDPSQSSFNFDRM